MTENNFIEKIEFNNVNWFIKKSEINFEGYNEIQNLIEFYLKDKINAKRFKINCILGNNWSGKTKILSNIIHFFEKDIDKTWEKNLYFWKNKYEEWGLVETNCTYIFDDYFILSDMNNFSINKNILNSKNYNKFYSDILLFLNKDINKNIFSSFLNLEENYKIKLNVNFKNWKHNYWSKKSLLSFYEHYWKSSKENINDISKNIEYKWSLKFFLVMKNILIWADVNSTIFKLFWKVQIKYIWLMYIDLFLAMINHFNNDLNIRKLLKWDIKNKEFFNSEQYKNYKKSLEILKYFLDNILNDSFIKDILTKQQLKNLYNEKNNILKNFQYIKNNLNILLKNLDFLVKYFEEKNILNYKQKYPFKNYKNENILYEKFCDIVFNSKSKYILTNLLFWYEDIWIYNTNVNLNRLKDSKVNVEKNAKELYNINDMFHSWIYEIYDEIVCSEKYNCFIDIFPIEDYNILKNKFLNLNLHFTNNKLDKTKSFNNLSAWEKTILTRFTNIYMKIIEDFENWKTNFIILIDEPDLHLHLDWQRQYIQKLIDVFSTLDKKIKLHFIIATHSPFIISDLPSECIIKLNRKNNNSFQEKYKNKSFWANFVDIIKGWFFFENKVLMGSFAEENIKDFSIAQKFLMVWIKNIKDDHLREKEKSILKFLINNKIEKVEDFKKYIDLIWDDFLKENLLYL